MRRVDPDTRKVDPKRSLLGAGLLTPPERLTESLRTLLTSSVEGVLRSSQALFSKALALAEHFGPALVRGQVLEGIGQCLEDMRAGRTQPLAEAFADIRRDLELPGGS